jgi:hypothetical protein
MSSHLWTSEQAQAWQRKQPWLVGCNFTPSTAINQLEMWQADSFDPATLQRELGWASSLGFNTVRVYLHDLAWLADQSGFKQRMQRYLEIASAAGIRTLFTIFDDCWNTDPQVGKQPAPKPGIHNSGWVQSPGNDVTLDPSQWVRLEDYVVDVVSAFKDDGRVLMWDVYNEPGNNGLFEKSLPLLKKAFEWTRAGNPSQPVTCALWFDSAELNAFQIANSDVITFHNYNNAVNLRAQIVSLRAYNRPLLCSEYMARGAGSTFYSNLPVFKEEGVGCINWGLVDGKTQTRYPWGHAPEAGEPEVWFHEIFYSDGCPYDPAEVAFIRSLTGAA